MEPKNKQEEDAINKLLRILDKFIEFFHSDNFATSFLLSSGLIVISLTLNFIGGMQWSKRYSQ